MDFTTPGVSEKGEIIEQSLPTTWGDPMYKNYASPRELMHCRLGHASDFVLDTIRENYRRDNPGKSHMFGSSSKECKCETCARSNAKTTHNYRDLERTTENKATRFLEKVYMDETGRLQIATYGNSRHATVFVDEYTGWSWVYIHETTSDAYKILLDFLYQVHGNMPDSPRVGTLVFDQSSSHMTFDFLNILKWYHITGECAAAGRHHQNGRAEKKIQDIVRMARQMLNGASLPREFWGWSLRYACFLQNRLPKQALNKKSPYEMRYKVPPDLSMCKTFGCLAIPRQKDHAPPLDTKFGYRGPQAIFLGVQTDGGDLNGVRCKAYTTWSLTGGPRIIITDDVTFCENVFPRVIGPLEWEFTSISGFPRRQQIEDRNFLHAQDEVTPYELASEEKQMPDKSWRPEMMVGWELHWKEDDQKYLIEEYGHESLLWRIRRIPPDKETPPLPIYEKFVNFRELFNSANKLVDKRADAKLPSVDFVASIWDCTVESGAQDQEGKKNGVEGDNVPRELKHILVEECGVSEDQQGMEEFVEACNKIIDREVLRDPANFKEAMLSEQKDEWIKAMLKEIQGLVDAGSWKAVPPMPGVKPIMTKWAYKIKKRPDGSVEKFKARFCCRGDQEIAGIHYDEVFAAVANSTIARMMFSIACVLDMEIELVDITAAFVQAPIQKDVYLLPAEGVCEMLSIPPNYLLKLHKSLYGLSSSPRSWHLYFLKWFEEVGFHPITEDSCLLARERIVDGEKRLMIALIYVDDCALFSNSKEEMIYFKNQINEKFPNSAKGDLDLYLGIEVKRDRKARTLTIFQESSIKKLVVQAGLEKATTTKTPFPTGLRLKRHTGTPHEHSRYRSLVGQLIWLSWTRADIQFAVSELSSHCQCPSIEHHAALNYVVRYLKGTATEGITYGKNVKPEMINVLELYSDADFAGCSDTRKSRTGWVCMMNGAAISYKSKLQSLIALSTTDSEIYSAVKGVQEAKYLREVLATMGIIQPGPTVLYEDNNGTIAISKNPELREATKHIGTRKSFLRWAVTHQIVVLKYIKTGDQLADIFTKALPYPAFVKHWTRIRGDA